LGKDINYGDFAMSKGMKQGLSWIVLTVGFVLLAPIAGTTDVASAPVRDAEARNQVGATEVGVAKAPASDALAGRWRRRYARRWYM
jgi:hypothetical protein